MREIAIRPALEQDYPSFVRLFPELMVGDPVPGQEKWRNEIAPSALIAERDGRVLGYAYFQTIGSTGYIRNIVVAPETRGQGVGRRIMEELRQRFRGSGMESWELNVKADNHAAIGLYERSGMRSKYRATALGVSWDLVDSLSEPEVAVDAQIVQPQEDESFERSLGLIAGQLRTGRAQPGRVIVGLVQVADGTPAGLGIFDPAFPGASPFRVAHPSFVGALLAGMRPYARSGQTTLGLFIEADEAAVAVLKATGATVRLEALHYFGEL